MCFCVNHQYMQRKFNTAPLLVYVRCLSQVSNFRPAKPNIVSTLRIMMLSIPRSVCDCFALGWCFLYAFWLFVFLYKVETMCTTHLAA